MRRHKKVRSGMPMLEMVIVIGMFSIISVFLLQLFVSADRLQKNAERLSKSVVAAQSVVEAVKSTDTWEEAVSLLGFSVVDENTEKVLVKYYDNEWNVSDKIGKYTVKLYINKTNGKNSLLYRLNVVVQQENSKDNVLEPEIIYTLEAEKLQQKGFGESNEES